MIISWRIPAERSHVERHITEGSGLPGNVTIERERPVEKIWHKNYMRGVPRSIKFEDITVSQALARTASRFPNVNALMFQGTEMTFRELDEAVKRFATSLRSIGVKPGARVSIILPNLIQTVVGIYSVLYAGAVAVMHNPRLDDMLLQHQLNDTGSETVICLDVLVPRLISLRNRTHLKTVISCHIRDYLPFVKKQLSPWSRRTCISRHPRGQRLSSNSWTCLMPIIRKSPRIKLPCKTLGSSFTQVRLRGNQKGWSSRTAICPRMSSKFAVGFLSL